MDSLEPDSQSFIVKVWVEDHTEPGSERKFRGHITHVTTQKRRYLKSLNGIEDFIVPYLEGMGVKLGIRWKVRLLFKRFSRKVER